MIICEHEKCTGCSACANVCPCYAIELIPDDEGFLYPSVDENLCTNCGKCIKKCPINVKNSLKTVPESVESYQKKAYAGYSLCNEQRRKTSSGGVFALLADEVIRENGIICAAGFSPSHTVIHKCTNKPEELYGSKYVQSDMGQIIREIGSLLNEKKPGNEGKTVLFCGTPCQAAAVKNVIGDNENLYIIDLICHGVPSPKVFSKYLKEISDVDKIKSISFRDKKKGWDIFGMKIASEDKTYYKTKFEDPFLRLYMKNIFLRPCCYDCNFKDYSSSSDITLGDFWGISKVFPVMNDDKGVSAIIINTEKGNRLLEKIKSKLELKETEVTTVEKFNSALVKSVDCPEQYRNEFFSRINYDKIEKLADLYTPALSSFKITVIRAKIYIKKVISKILKYNIMIHRK